MDRLVHVRHIWLHFTQSVTKLSKYPSIHGQRGREVFFLNIVESQLPQSPFAVHVRHVYPHKVQSSVLASISR